MIKNLKEPWHNIMGQGLFKDAIDAIDVIFCCLSTAELAAYPQE